MPIKIIARKMADARHEMGDIITVREGTHQWTATEEAPIGTLWVEIVVNEDPPNPIGYYKQPLADLEIIASDGVPKNISVGKQVVKETTLLGVFPWDGENTPNYHMPAKSRAQIVPHKRRRFQVDVSGIEDRVTLATWTELQAILTDKRG